MTESLPSGAMKVAEPSRHSGSWAVFNSGGAWVIGNVSRAIAANYMTADRFERGWTMVSVVAIESMADLATAPPVAAGALPAGVDEALQRLIENAATMGPASRDDALLVARHRAALSSAKREAEPSKAPCVKTENFCTLFGDSVRRVDTQNTPSSWMLGLKDPGAATQVEPEGSDPDSDLTAYERWHGI